MFDIKVHMKARSVDEAIDLLAQHPHARVIAGGTDVLIRLRQGNDSYAELVDIHDLDDLRFIETDDSHNIRIGSGTVFADLIHSDIINAQVPILSEAAASVGGPQIRNIATIGGNICNGVPSADSAPGLFVLNAQLEIQGQLGTRQVPVADFYLGPGKVDLKPAEILTAITITRNNYQNYAGHYYKYAMRRAMDIATIGCAVSLKTGAGRIRDFRMAFGVAGPTPLRCPASEQVAAGQVVSEQLFADIADAVCRDVNPRTSWRASREFRLHLIAELSRRVTRTALERAGEWTGHVTGLEQRAQKGLPAEAKAGQPNPENQETENTLTGTHGNERCPRHSKPDCNDAGQCRSKGMKDEPGGFHTY
jgi:xanthine dehydrogenase FAD-binding subunit